MERIKGATKQTDNRFLNLYELQAVQRNGTKSSYQMASRAKTVEDLKAISGDIKADAVAVYATYDGKLVLIRQLRYPVGGYIYELPAGLADGDEDIYDTAIREMFEETGLTFIPRASFWSGKPYFSSPGMTDETCAIVMGYCSGTPTNANQEETEDIQVVLADVEECYRIVKEENIDMRTAWAILLYLTSCEV